MRVGVVLVPRPTLFISVELELGRGLQPDYHRTEIRIDRTVFVLHGYIVLTVHPA